MNEKINPNWARNAEKPRIKRQNTRRHDTQRPPRVKIHQEKSDAKTTKYIKRHKRIRDKHRPPIKPRFQLIRLGAIWTFIVHIEQTF